MVPANITNNLSQVRSKEKFHRALWGGARIFAIVLGMLLFACLVDWVIDRFQETPAEVRAALLFLQVGVFAVMLVFFVLLPLLQALSDDTLALWIEDKHRRLCHRLISAVQLNRPHADSKGMSRELIQVMTREAERECERIDFPAVVSNRRLGWSAAVAGPALLLFLVPFLIWPSVFPVLLARQFQASLDIPRSVYLYDGDNAPMWPSGEALRLTIRARGPGVTEDAEGYLTVTWDRADKGSKSYPLTRIGPVKDEEALFAVDLPGWPDSFSYGANIGDGRLAHAGRVSYVSRPIVKEEAFVQLPEYCGKTADGKRFEQYASRGDLEGIPGSHVRLEITVQDQVDAVRVHLYSKQLEGEDDKGNLLFTDVPRGKPLAVKLDDYRTKGRVEFPLEDIDPETKKPYPPLSHYAIEAVKEHRWTTAALNEGRWKSSGAERSLSIDNRPRPTRTLRLIEEPKPEVSLLPEYFGPAGGFSSKDDDYNYTGMPAAIGVGVGKPFIRVRYKSFGRYGLGCAYLEYRRAIPLESGDDEEKKTKKAPARSEEWTSVGLREAAWSKELGAFRLELGEFENSDEEDSIGFYALPAELPGKLGRVNAGGRYDLNLLGLIAGREKLVLKKGDQLEYRIKVYADKDPFNDKRPWGVSETRVTTVEDQKGFEAWMQAMRIEQDHIRLLKLRDEERRLFGGKK